MRTWRRLGSICFVFGFSVLVPVLAQPQAQDPLAVAEAMLQRGQFAQAEALLRQTESASSPRGHYLMGFTLIQLYRFDEAEAELQEAVAARQEPAWLHALAKSQLEQDKNRSALESAQRAIALDPAPDYLFAAAMAALNMGELDTAEGLLERCVAAGPGIAEAHYKLARLRVDRGEYEAARPQLVACLKSAPGHLEARYLSGLVARRSGDLEGAVAALEVVVAEVPGHVGALFNLGGALIELGRAEEGRRRLDQFRAMSELQDVIEFHLQAIRKNPDSVDGRLYVAGQLLRAGRADEALEQLLAARQLAPGRAEIYRELALTFERLGRQNESQQAARFAAQLEGR